MKDTEIPTSSCAPLYAELVLTVRRMYHRCKLVHADLSEYNLLFHDAHLYIIDVSQSVEHDHPSAFDFLREDIKHVEEFFGRRGVRCLGVRRCFEFVTKEKVSEGDEDEEDAVVLARWLAETVEVGGPSGDPDDPEAGTTTTTAAAEEDKAHEDAVFLRSYIPRSLNELFDPERDVAMVNRGEGSKLIYSDTIGLVEPAADRGEQEGVGEGGASAVAIVRGLEAGDEEEEVESKDSEAGSGSESSEADEDPKALRPRGGHRHEDRDVRKVRTPSRQPPPQ